MRTRLVFLFAILAGCSACSVKVTTGDNPDGGGADMTQTMTGGGMLKLTSSAFAANATIPAKYADNVGGCGSGTMNVSPPLAWSGAPAGTKSFAIVMEDVFFSPSLVHWGMYDIPATVSQLAENAAAQPAHPQSKFGYLGPCPPPGETHDYKFTLYALSVDKLGVTDPMPDDLKPQTAGKVLAESTLTGKYTNN